MGVNGKHFVASVEDGTWIAARAQRSHLKWTEAIESIHIIYYVNLNSINTSHHYIVNLFL